MLPESHRRVCYTGGLGRNLGIAPSGMTVPANRQRGAVSASPTPGQPPSSAKCPGALPRRTVIKVKSQQVVQMRLAPTSVVQ